MTLRKMAVGVSLGVFLYAVVALCMDIASLSSASRADGSPRFWLPLATDNLWGLGALCIGIFAFVKLFGRTAAPNRWRSAAPLPSLGILGAVVLSGSSPRASVALALLSVLATVAIFVAYAVGRRSASLNSSRER